MSTTTDIHIMETSHGIPAPSSTAPNSEVHATPSKATTNGSTSGSTEHDAVTKKYRHIGAVHSKIRASCLSRDTEKVPSFVGLRNLTVIVLIVMNLRLMVENFTKYGVLICLRCHDYRKQDVILGVVLYLLTPCHLLVAYVIELAAAQQAKGAIGRRKKTEIGIDRTESVEEHKAFQAAWWIIAIAHTINATLNLLISSFVVYYYIHHPGIGTVSELHAVVVWLKTCSYAFTNRDLRHALLNPFESSSLPAIYASCPYPQNITLKNLTYFWWAPTLVYQPVYPRTNSIRWMFVFKRVLEVTGLSVFIWLISAQYGAPLLRNSLDKLVALDIVSILERIMKMSTISLVIWLAGFFALFQSFLNALAEIMRFGDREFYTDWWNSPSLGVYWRTWNKPVYSFMKRHVYFPLVGRGCPSKLASAMVFVLSGILHELLVGVPTHNILGELDCLSLAFPCSDGPFRCRMRGNALPDSSDPIYRSSGGI
ncbi:MAG: hypothetical protein M1834_006819 [Cirrosporium novae-zelandiae]|nr:MAG: hypothetical protein M1834_006819 [Cirrosporium novae-zelandiae]